MNERGKEIYAFVDSANLFYGGEKSLRFRIDYEKLIKYLREKLSVTKVFYYAGVDVDQFKLESREIDLKKLAKYYQEELLPAKGGLSPEYRGSRSTKKDRTEEETALLEMHQKRVNFYLDLEKFGYELRMKPTKVFTSTEGTTTTKANCDVDLTFDMMRYMSQYNEAVVLSGDGDFAPIVEYLMKKHKKIRVLARSERTAREMRELAGDNFVDFKSIRKEIEAGKIDIDSRVRGNDKGGKFRSKTSKPEVKPEGRRRIPTFRKGF